MVMFRDTLHPGCQHCFATGAGGTEGDASPPHQSNALQAAQTMVLQHLSLSAQAGDATSGSAATFTICRMFFEEVCCFTSSSK